MISREDIKNFVENNPRLVARRATQRKGVWVLKYKNRVFYDNLWNPILQECRGTIVDDDYNIISRPFTKIFNRGERDTDINPNNVVVAVEKINGFMGCATWYDGDVFVSTTGSIDSEFADLAKYWINMLPKELFKNFSNLSFSFEIVDESDPHIIKEKPGIYLLNARCKTWTSPAHALAESQLDRIGQKYGIYRPTWMIVPFSVVLKGIKKLEREGYVCYTQSQDQELKIKSPFYLITKFLGRVRIDKLDKLMKNKRHLLETIDEEYYPLIDDIESHWDMFSDLDQQDRISYIRNFLSNI